MLENKSARGLGEPRAFVLCLDARPRMLDQLSELDTGRAGGFARAAIQAFVDVVDEDAGKRQLSFVHQNHLADSASGRIGFQLPEPIGGAVTQAEPAVHTAGVVFVAWSCARNGFGRWQLEASDDTARCEDI